MSENESHEVAGSKEPQFTDPDPALWGPARKGAIGQFFAPPVLAMISAGPQGWAAVCQATALFAAGNVVGGVLMWRLMVVMIITIF